MTDAALVERCRLGDADAWTQLIHRYQRLVFSIPLHEGLSPDDAADVAQATFGQLLRQLDSLVKPESVGGWLCTVARRLSWQVRSGRNDELPIGLDPEPIDVSESEIDHVASQYWVHGAVLELPEPGRSLIVALFFHPEPPSYEELARRLGRPVGSIGPLRARALSKLRDLLEAADDR